MNLTIAVLHVSLCELLVSDCELQVILYCGEAYLLWRTFEGLLFPIVFHDAGTLSV